ncbi:MAG: oxygen-independent coproporphyrinogen III oxidase [Roseicyclus sp.]
MDHVSQLRRMGLFDAKVPRYTSYPPATKFSGDVDGAQYLNWLSSIPSGSRISLYLHVPFCRKLCWFCACRTQGMRSDGPVIAYVESLKAEIAVLAGLLPEGVEIARLHWGGGTPTLLSPALMTDLSRALHEAFDFTGDAEFSVEIDPNEIDSARIDALVAAGMSRASIGVQDFDPHIQEVIGRIQTYEVTRQAVEALRAAGVGSLNADILFGLPDQDQARMAASVQMLLSLMPDRVALYGYAHVPWMAKRQSLIPTDALPGPEDRVHLYDTARELFLWDGYRDIGIDHFARPDDGLAKAAAAGRLRRNFQGYTDDTCDVLIGLGASAISRFPQGYAQNASGTAAYQKAVRAGDLATGRGHVFRGDDRMRARMIEMLLCDFRIDTTEITQGFKIARGDLAEMFARTAAAFPGMVEATPDAFRILPEGRPLARMIARGFDAYEMCATGHSPAF